MKQNNVVTLAAMKARGEKISQLTCYDYSTARLMDQAGINMILVGDSLGMTMQGYSDTLPVTLEEMILYGRSVARGCRNAFVVLDMPFMSYQVSPEQALANAGRMMKETGVDGVKLEGGEGICPQIRAITDHDDMDLYTLGEKKCALYAVIPDNDNTFNFLVSLLYSQAFQTLYYSADQIHHGALPQHVHFVLDEFAAMPLPGYTRELATMRSRNISSSTIIQNMAQIKELYKDSWETIPGNSDTILYLGGNEQSTHKYISEALGKATIDTKTHGQTKGKSGSYSTNFQMSGRELLTPDEVRALDNRYCILFIRGAKPVMDLKYELTEHPAIRYTVDGGGAPYIHHGHNTAPAIPGIPFFQVISADETNKEKETAA